MAGVSAAVIEDEGFLTLRNGRQVQHLEATLLLQVAGKVVLVHPLHDHNDAGRSLVVGARHNVERYQSMTRVRTASDMASPGFKGIIDDDQVATEAGEGPVDGSGDPLAALGGDDLAVSVARKAHAREQHAPCRRP